jgi:hypothetical protein
MPIRSMVRRLATISLAGVVMVTGLVLIEGAQPASAAPSADICDLGYVWREAVANDHPPAARNPTTGSTQKRPSVGHQQRKRLFYMYACGNSGSSTVPEVWERSRYRYRALAVNLIETSYCPLPIGAPL